MMMLWTNKNGLGKIIRPFTLVNKLMAELTAFQLALVTVAHGCYLKNS